jgi:hypothetical protein
MSVMALHNSEWLMRALHQNHNSIYTTKEIHIIRLVVFLN